MANLKVLRIKKEDTDYTYVLRAYNDLGQQEYKIKISTSAEPEGKLHELFSFKYTSSLIIIPNKYEYIELCSF